MTVQVDTVTARPLLTLTVQKADANETFRRFIQADGTRAGAGERTLGVVRERSAVDDTFVPVDVAGIVLVVAGAAIAADAVVASDDEGRAVTQAGAAVVAGKALAAAAAEDDHVPVLIGLAH